MRFIGGSTCRCLDRDQFITCEAGSCAVRRADAVVATTRALFSFETAAVVVGNHGLQIENTIHETPFNFDKISALSALGQVEQSGPFS